MAFPQILLPKFLSLESSALGRLLTLGKAINDTPALDLNQCSNSLVLAQAWDSHACGMAIHLKVEFSFQGVSRRKFSQYLHFETRFQLGVIPKPTSILR